MKMARKICAIFYAGSGGKLGFSTASTCAITGFFALFLGFLVMGGMGRM